MAFHLINRELIIHRDLALGTGTVNQTRGGVTAAEQKIELDFIFRTADEIRYLDITRYTRVSLHENGPLAGYYFDPNSVAVDDGNSVLAPVPALASGRWIKTGATDTVNSYDSIAQLRADIAIVPTLSHNQQTNTGGYYTPGDFGGGTYYWDSFSTDSDDGGLTFLPVGWTDPGRWKRIVHVSMSVHEFGAKGDGITVDTIAFENALIAASNTGLVLTVKDITYLVTGLDVTLPNSLWLHGVGTPLLKGGTNLVLQGIDVEIKDVSFLQWSGGIQLNPQQASYYNFEHIGFQDCAYGIYSPDNVYTNKIVRVVGGQFNGSGMDRAIYFAGPTEFVDIYSAKISGLGNGVGATYGIAIGLTNSTSEIISIRDCQIEIMTAETDYPCHAIFVRGQNVIIDGNIIKNILGTGAGKTAIFTAADDCIITHNIIENGGAKYYIECNLGTTHKNRVIANNVLTGETGIVSTAGMLITGKTTVTGNRITGDAIIQGMKIVGITNAQQMIITDNFIECVNASQGIDIQDLINSTITSNSIKVAGTGILARPPALSTYALYNTLINNNYIESLTGIGTDFSANIRMDNNVFKSVTTKLTGTYKQGWWFVDGVMSEDTSEFTDIAAPVNVMPFKQAGLIVWDETTEAPLWAKGATPGSVWIDATGATIYTPI